MGPLLTVAFLALGAAPDARAVELDAGGQKVLAVPAGSRASVERPDVLEVRSLGETSLLLVGKAVGSTKLVVTGPDRTKTAWQVTVRKFDPEKVVAGLKALVGDVDGLTITLEGRCARSDCPGCTIAQAEQVARVMALYPCVSSVHRLTPRRDAAVVLAGARQLLGEGPDDTPGLVLDLRDGEVVLSGEARTGRDILRVEHVRGAFPEVKIRVSARPERPDASR